jgi:hypothetical protein
VVSPWEDGTRVKFTDEFRKSLASPTGHLLRDRLGDADPEWVFTISNDIQFPSLHDVKIVELGVNFGITWLQPIDGAVRHAWFLLDQGRNILALLNQAEGHRSEMNDALFAADASKAADGHDPRDLSAPDLAATLRLMHSPLAADIAHWEMENIHRVESWLRAKTAYEDEWPEYPLMERFANA